MIFIVVNKYKLISIVENDIHRHLSFLYRHFVLLICLKMNFHVSNLKFI